MKKMKLTEKMRHRRERQALAHVFESATPNMRRELHVIAVRQNYVR